MLRPLLAASAVLLIALPARGEPSPDAATLTYLPSRATAAFCPAANFFVLEVQIRLGYALFQPSAPNHLTLKVERENGLFRSTGEMRDGSGRVIFTRVYSEIDCGTVLVSMAISVALELTKLPEEPEPSPPAPLQPASSSPALLPAPCPPAPKPIAPEPPKPPALAPAERPRLQTGLAAVFSMGAAPVVVGGVAGFVGLRLGSYSLALEGSALFAQSATIDNLIISAGYHYIVKTAAGLGCYHGNWVFVCARAEASVLSVSNSEAKVKGAQTVSLGLGAHFGIEWALTRGLALRTYGEFLLRPIAGLLRDVNTGIDIWSGPGMSGSIGFGPVFSFSTF